MIGYNSKAKEESPPLKKQIHLEEVLAWVWDGHFLQSLQDTAVSSSLTKAEPCPPTLPRHSHFLQSLQGMTISSSLTKALTFSPVLPRHGHVLQPHPGMAISSSLTNSWPFPPVSPRHGHVLWPHQDMATSSKLTQHGHFLQAVQTTRAQHSHTQPPSPTTLQNQILVAGKPPPEELSLQENSLNWQPVNPAQCLCVTGPYSLNAPSCTKALA